MRHIFTAVIICFGMFLLSGCTPVEIPIPTYSKPDVIPSSGPLPQIEEGKK